ncbi:MAG: 23S rRNA (uridine(2552)-2'-O)-methyltransferase RlmE [Pseudomonadales bacterium]|nr:23S rRNA (uridine(2552)-2'-O)-methyltransferase RlmE [Pseudomonadales bacterium]
MAKSKSSKRWMQEHVNDPYVKRAQIDGYRSRASYKLIEINNKDKLIRPGMLVMDLGSAPGGWSQVAGPWVGDKGRIIATDILPMDALPYTDFIQGDFTEDAVFEQIITALDGKQVDVVLSDMAPNITGISSADQASSMYLVELALDMARQVLKPQGSFVTKVFHGEGYDALLKDVRSSFDKVAVRKPDSSRARSSEVYIVAKGFRQKN